MTRPLKKFTPSEIEKLGDYVYVYTDPRNDAPFYVGKGCGNRIFAHLEDQSESQKVLRITEIRDAGFEPKIEILAFKLDAVTALKVEAAAIDLVGIGNLTNRQIGHHARKFGRRSMDAVHAELSSESLTSFAHNMVLIKINGTYPDASEKTAFELYDATRGTWRVQLKNAEKATYAAAVFGGVIREVYHIAKWLPAESTQYFDSKRDNEPNERYEFVGKVANEKVRKCYLWQSVAKHYKRGAANPIMYVGPAFPKPVVETQIG